MIIDAIPAVSKISMATQHTIVDDNFLLQNKAAKNLYFNYAASLPIIDYHNHLPPNQIAENKQFSTITELWLKGDHYKWRAMRSLGVNEKYITGNSTDEEKFVAWATCFPQTIRNPLFHWSQMELQNPFGIHEYLHEKNALEIYHHCNDLLAKPNFSTKKILQHFNVEMLGTTDDPIDNLQYHQQLKQDEFEVNVLPSFRPDKIFAINNRNAFVHYLNQLSSVAKIPINNIQDLIAALESRIAFFHQQGCRIADHGLTQMPSEFIFSSSLENEFISFLQNDDAIPFSNPESFAGYILMTLCKMYHQNNWVQQFHLGAIRNNNSRLMQTIGADVGVDSIGDYTQAIRLSNFLNALDQSNQLAKTIVYNLNPADNEVFASMCGNFNDGSTKGKIQYGAGWWFLDQKDGIEKQLNALSNMGIISTFIGMLTDSRSFLSYSRHEYFRRILCNVFGAEMENGLLPNDEKWIGNIIQNICYFNAKQYFNF
jgi:glucuronate isomerase